MGYDVLGTASRASDAVSQVLELMPDLVLMDINLKGEMDGIEAAARITSSSMSLLFTVRLTRMRRP